MLPPSAREGLIAGAPDRTKNVYLPRSPRKGKYIRHPGQQQRKRHARVACCCAGSEGQMDAHLRNVTNIASDDFTVFLK